MKPLIRTLRSAVVYSVCASLVALPYAGPASAAPTPQTAQAVSEAQALTKDLVRSVKQGVASYKDEAMGLTYKKPQSNAMSSSQIEEIMGIRKDDKQFTNRASTYGASLAQRAKTATGTDDPEAQAFAILKKSAIPKNTFNTKDGEDGSRMEPIFRSTLDVLDNQESLQKAFGDCTQTEGFALQERVVHLPVYEQCTQVIDKTGTCEIRHLYDMSEPILHSAGPYNINNCGEGCVRIWIGKVGDNYWEGWCSVFEEVTQVQVTKPFAVTEAIIDFAKWDDYMQIWVGPPGQEELVWGGPDGKDVFPPETPGKCERSTSWKTNPGVDVTRFFQSVEPGTLVNFKIRVSVSGGGEGYGRINIKYDPAKLLQGDSWTPPECFDVARAISDGMASGGYKCTEMPGNVEADGKCFKVGDSYRVCEDVFGASPLPGIPRLCRKVEVTANYSFYKGDMECYKASDGTTVCPKNTGGNLDTCRPLINSGCQYVKSECTEGANGNSGACYVYTSTYDCGYDQIVKQPVSGAQINCEGEIQCLGEDCIGAQEEGSPDFARAAALLQVAQQASKDMSCTGMDEDGNVTEQDNVNCNLFGGEAMDCKVAVGGVQDCCDQPTNVSLADYIMLTFSLYKADSAMMALDASKSPAFVGTYQALHNSAVGAIKTTFSEVSGPLTSYVENIAGTVKQIYTPIEAFMDGIKKMIEDQIASLIDKLAVKMGIKSAGTLAGAGAGGSSAQAGGELAAKSSTIGQSTVSALGTAFAVVGYVYMAYQIAMMIIQTVYKCEEKEFKLASNRALRQCHYIGSYCKTKFIGCIEKRFSYCCYKSPLARILQEQMQVQLKGAAQPFGSAKNPQCGGVSIEDFAKIDWNAINLDEWIAIVQESGYMGGDLEKLSMEGLTGEGSTNDISDKEVRLDAASRAAERLNGIKVDDAREKVRSDYSTMLEIKNNAK